MSFPTLSPTALPDGYDVLPVGVLRFGTDGFCTHANLAACHMLGRTRAELCGQRVDAGPFRDGTTVFRVRTCLERRERARWLARLEHGPGSGGWVEWIAEVETEALVILLVPASNGDADLEHLRRAERLGALGLLAGGVAHDLNNHLTVITALADLLHRGDHGTADLEDIRAILDAANRASDLVRRLLAYGRPLPQDSPIDAVGAVSGVLDLVRRLIPPEVRLTIQTGSTPGLVGLDRSAIEQVVMNLVLNARDAISGPGQIAVAIGKVEPQEGELVAATREAVPAGAYIDIRVSDTGKGLAADDLDRIFEPFFTTKTSAGHGLGLATVLALVRQARGFVLVSSVPGSGTTFRVLLPRLT